jgi:RHS repeat-associated protein
MSAMPHLQAMDWDFAERLNHITRGTTEAYYNYDGSGQRVRKVVEKGGTVETRLYLGGFEVFRKKVGGNLELERETLHIMDDKRRIAIVETKTVDNGTIVNNPIPVQRYQLSNNIESATLELDENANIISYEEYYPYGETSYRAGRNITEVGLKRYRYNGKEKDEESGLYYYGARYYACWIGRWTTVDPAGLVDGLNLYMYVRGNPVKLIDPEGNAGEEFFPTTPMKELENLWNYAVDKFKSIIPSKEATYKKDEAIKENKPTDPCSDIKNDTYCFDEVEVKPFKSTAEVGPVLNDNVRITSSFGLARVHPTKGTIQDHKGIDLGTSDENKDNIPIIAMEGGKIVKLVDKPDNNYAGVRVGVLTDDGKYRLNYMHLVEESNSHLKGKERVEKGDTLGMMGKTGEGSGVHLHFEVRSADNKTAYDPSEIYPEFEFYPKK